MPPNEPRSSVIHIQKEFGDIDPRTGRTAKPSETAIHGLRRTRDEERELPPAPRRPETK